MPNVAMYNTKGEKVGEIELNDDIFGAQVNVPLMHQVVTAIMANRRQGTHSALTRAEVRGGGIKPWRQKGTGRARQGSTRSPQWRHGGVVFAKKPRSFRKSVNRKMRRLAMKSALSSKVRDNEILVLDSIELSEGKTKLMAEILGNLGVEKRSVIVLPEGDELVERAARNIPYIKTLHADMLSVVDVLDCERFIITKAAAERIEEVLAI